MAERPAYPSDLSDARWALIAPRLTAWRQARTDAGIGGRTASHDLRIVTDTLGLLLAVVVTAASASDNTVGIDLLEQ
ncbi:hypothetical protein AB0G13_34485, partial [Micromonospora sp. NPDC023633]